MAEKNKPATTGSTGNAGNTGNVAKPRTGAKPATPAKPAPPAKTAPPAKPQNTQTQAQARERSLGIMQDNAMALTMLHDGNVRNKATTTMRMAVVSMAFNMLLVCVMASMALRPIRDDYYWTTGDNTVHPMLALDQPVLSDTERSTWVTEVVTNAFNMDFNNVNQRIWASRGNFTADGFRSFREALQTSGLIDGIIKYKYRLSAVPSAPVVQVGMGELDNQQGWQYQLPMLLTYEAGDNTRTTQSVVVQIIVLRVSESENPRGMAIARFLSR